MSNDSQNNESTAVREMPRYKCHKEVWALKIAQLEPHGDGAFIRPADEGYAPFKVDAEFLEKHKPQAGGYYVVYDDGYKSYSPAAPFETGYTQIGDAAAEESKPTDPNPPHATIALRLENNGINIEVTNNVSTMTEVLHFANWIGHNLDALVLLARQDWHLRNEMNRLALEQQTQELQRQAEGGEQPAIDTGRPRLVSANGGPLQ